MTRIPLLRFMAFDLPGNAFERMVRGAHRWEPAVCGLLAIAGLIIWSLIRTVGKRAEPSAG